MLMSDHDDAYVDAMLMVNMQANTRSVTSAKLTKKRKGDGSLSVFWPRGGDTNEWICVRTPFSGWWYKNDIKIYPGSGKRRLYVQGWIQVDVAKSSKS